MGPMAFVPEGQADRSLARSAWVNATPKSRPVGCGLIRAGVRWRFDDWSNEISNTKTKNIYVVCGTSCARSSRTLRDGSFEGRFPRHFVPGYYLLSLRDKNHSTAEALLKSALMGKEGCAARDPSLEMSKLQVPLGRRTVPKMPLTSRHSTTAKFSSPFRATNRLFSGAGFWRGCIASLFFK
jgi:hypothetical protein